MKEHASFIPFGRFSKQEEEEKRDLDKVEWGELQVVPNYTRYRKLM